MGFNRRKMEAERKAETPSAEPAAGHGLSCMPPAAGVASDGRVSDARYQSGEEE